MINLLIATVLAFATSAHADFAVVHFEGGGTIIAVDAAGKTFTCHWKSDDSTYKTTDKTAFLIARKAADLSDLKVGETVTIDYHLDGNERVADQVTVTEPKSSRY